MVFFSDGLDADLGAITTLKVINGADFSNSLGSWRKEGTSAVADKRRGYVEYDVNLVEAGTFMLSVKGRENKKPMQNNFNLKLFVDDIFVSTRVLTANCRNEEEVMFMLPHLTAGDHTFRIYCDNADFKPRLRINSLSFKAVAGEDTDENGKADWLDNRLSQMCEVNNSGLSDTAFVAAATSPACVEGNGYFLNMMSLTESDGTELALNNNAGKRWFANVELNPEETKTVDVAFQNGAKTVETALKWTTTNIAAAVEPITIRKGDSLKLVARPETATGGSYTISVDSTVVGTKKHDDYLVYKFDTAGTFALEGVYTAPDGKETAYTAQIDVVDYKAVSSDQLAVVGDQRNIAVNAKPAEVVFDMPSDVGLITQTDKKITIKNEETGSAYVVARVGEDGPVIDSFRIHTADIARPSVAGVFKDEVLEDGSTVVKMFGVVSNPHEDLNLKLDIFVSGVVFIDGTRTKTITMSDLDELNMYTVYFVYPPETKTSVCHHLKALQGGITIGGY